MVPTVDASWTVFVDRDGVVNRRVVGDYVRSLDQFELLPGAVDGLRLLSRHVRRVVIVTNQQGIGKGLVTEDDLAEIHGWLVAQVEAAGGRVDAVVHCPHLSGDGCDCRKPGPGMARQASALFPDIDLGRAVMVGDSAGDLGFARGLDIPAVLVTGTGGDGVPAAADAVADSLLDAARLLTATATAKTD